MDGWDSTTSRWKKKLFQPHPLLGYSHTPDNQIVAPFRKKEILQNIGPDGFRVTPFQGARKHKKIVFYGCSFTYGVGLSDTETFTALLQKEYKSTRITNKGVSGYGTLQNFLQLQLDVKKNDVDVAVFGFISKHIYRNIVVHPMRLTEGQVERWKAIGIEHMPRVRMRRDGLIGIDYFPVSQFRYDKNVIDQFSVDDFLTDLATVSLFKAINKFGSENNVKIIIALMDKRQNYYNQLLQKQVVENVIDISIPINAKHTWLPLDTHPNVNGNRVYFEKLAPIIETFLDTPSAKTKSVSKPQKRGIWSKITGKTEAQE